MVSDVTGFTTWQMYNGWHYDEQQIRFCLLSLLFIQWIPIKLTFLFKSLADDIINAVLPPRVEQKKTRKKTTLFRQNFHTISGKTSTFSMP